MSIAAAVPASTVVLLRGDHPFEVFLVRRNDSIAFLGGAHVFPGGRVDPSDHIHDFIGSVRHQADPYMAATENLTSRMPDVPADVAIAHHVAAVRELFEEAGVLLARPLTAASVQRLTADRRELLAGRIMFGDIVRREHLHLALDELAYFAHWVTPEIEIRRFDTRFFIARAPEGQTPIHDAGETTHSEWAEPARAIESCRAGGISLPPPTWTTLQMLSRFDSVDAVLDWARRKPIPRVQPRFEKRGSQTLLFYPGDPMYPPVEGFDATETRFVLENRRWMPITPD
jgi:8-oxo-dGTP pyrophosphatase MutT (NUDIX family)